MSAIQTLRALNHFLCNVSGRDKPAKLLFLNWLFVVFNRRMAVDTQGYFIPKWWANRTAYRKGKNRHLEVVKRFNYKIVQKKILDMSLNIGNSLSIWIDSAIGTYILLPRL